MKKVIGVLVLITIIVGVGFSIGHAQSISKLTGIWKMNPAKSKLGREGVRESTIKLGQEDSFITESISINGESILNLKYSTDGKEAATVVAGRPGQVSARWEGESLIVTLKVSGGGINIRKFILAPDGKTMTLIVHDKTDENGESEDMVIMEKQS